MGWPQCNTTLEDMRLTETPVWNDWTYHRIGLWLSAICGLIAIVISYVLIFLHATHYLRPHEQKHIIRILFMVPVYAAVSFLSYKYYWHSVYFEVLRDCYEAFAIASFFSLMCAYLAETLHDQKDYFRHIKPKPWVWPMGWLKKCCGGDRGCLRTPRSGLTWFNTIWLCVFQYCFIRVAMTIVAVVTQVFDRYCLESLNPAFSHVWVMVIEAGAVTIAMYCLIQFYVQIKADIKQHSPLQKITAIKLVIFLSFWQTILISFLTSAGAIKASDQFQTPDIKVGIPSMLLCIEMAIFSIFHLFAFSWRPYVIGSKQFIASTAADGKITPDQYVGGFLGIKAILDVFNPWDFIKAIGRSARWLVIGRRRRHDDISYDPTRTASELKLTKSSPSADSMHSSTAYKLSLPPPSPLTPHTHQGFSSSPNHHPDDRQNLLGDQQPGLTRPNPRQHESYDLSPYRPNQAAYFQESDIGMAQSTHGNAKYYLEPGATDDTNPPYAYGSHPERRPDSSSTARTGTGAMAGVGTPTGIHPSSLPPYPTGRNNEFQYPGSSRL